jgi:hypothetical protein
LAALITYAVSGISGIWLLKTDGMPLVTVAISDVTGSATAVVGLRLPASVTALLIVGRG